MALLDAPKRLFISNKTMTVVKQPEYGQDMRAIENFNPINKLLAGSGVTLSPADGTGPEVEISAAGGGGGGTGVWTFVSSPDLTQPGPPFGVIFSGTSFPNGGGPLGSSSWLTMDEPSIGGSHRPYTFVHSWWWNIFGGNDVVTYPFLDVPDFTGGGILASFTIMAAAPDFLDAAIWQTNPIAVVSGVQIVTAAADYVNNPEPPSGDLSLGATGMETAAGDVYFGAAQINLVVAPGTTFP